MEKVIKRKVDKIYVKWKGYDNSFNSWIDTFVPVPTGFSKLNDVVRNEVFKKDIHDELLNNVNAIDTSGLVKK